MNYYAISLRLQWLMLARLIFGTLAIVGLGIYIQIGQPRSILYLYFGLFLFLADILPTLIVHIQYYRANRGMQVSFDRHKDLLICKKNGAIEERNYDEIDSITFHSSYAYNIARGFYSFGAYCYYTISFRKGDPLIITCLMMEDIDIVLPIMLKRSTDRNRRSILATIKHSQNN